MLGVNRQEVTKRFTSFSRIDMIVKEGSKYILYSKDGTKKLGEFASKKAAEKREKQINYFKSLKDKLDK